VNTRTPRLSIGLPVYNGEAFLDRAIESLLGQTYADFELIICDNASTDGTEAICRSHATKDRRVRYQRNDHNVGAMGNFRKVFELSHGELFKWAAHDDEHEPEFLARCIDGLDADASVVLVHTRFRAIDEKENTLGVRSTGIDAASPRVARRFGELIRREYPCVACFGVVRADVLRRTRMLANYADSDRVLLAELGLAGRIVELEQPLFVRREHPNRSVRQFRSRQTRNAWFDPATAGRPQFPHARQFAGYLGAIERARISAAERAQCTAIMGRWVAHNGPGLWEDMMFAARFMLRPLKRRVMDTARRAGRGIGSLA
jgi:glycosyltransferase involved in cell wall biosynthesis